MAATLKDGQRKWSLEMDDDGHRTYHITHRVVTSSSLDGPFTVLGTPGLPIPGSAWFFDNDGDPWAFCTRWARVTPVIQGEPNTQWDVEQRFTTRPQFRCNDTQIEDPLLEPQRVSGSFVKYLEEAVKDRNGNLIKSSSHEMFRGPQVEFDNNKPAVHIEQNVPLLELATVAQMVDTVNDSPLWGLAVRCIKLSNVAWEKKYFGSCGLYFTRILDFDIDFDTFDRELLDEGTKVLSGDWDRDPNSATYGQFVLKNVGGAAPDPDNPQHFVRYKDRYGENARVILNGAGLPADTAISASSSSTGSGPPGFVDVEKFAESNFLLLSIPTDLEAP